MANKPHILEAGALSVERDGIMAKCVCGWISRGHFSSMGASVAFMNHQEQAALAVAYENKAEQP